MNRTEPAVYLLVDTQYEDCFKLFFKDALGYPNFYRLNDLMTPPPTERSLIVLTPQAATLEKISHLLTACQIAYLPFGENLNTEFKMTEQGIFATSPDFHQALVAAVGQFLAPKRALSA